MNPEQLRDAFEARAGQVEFGPDPLRAIRTRIDRRSRSRFRLRLVSLGGAAVATVAAVVIGVASCPAGAPAAAGCHPSAPPPRRPPGRRPRPRRSRSRCRSTAVGQQAGRSVLYREFRSATVRADTLNERIAAAVGLALSGPPLDPDYATPWPAGASVRSVSVDGGVSTVDVSVSPPSPIAVQQLVWTVTAVANDFNGTTLSGVRLTVNGSPQGGLLTRADATATQAAIWLLSPQQGETVHSPVDRAAERFRVRGGGPGAGAQRGRRGRLGPAGAAVHRGTAARPGFGHGDPVTRALHDRGVLSVRTGQWRDQPRQPRHHRG